MPNRKFRTGHATHNISIGGKLVNIHFAQIVYRCAECYGPLKVVNNGLKCVANPNHRFFIHRGDVAQLQERQAQNIETLNQFYEIVDGKVVIKCQS